MSKCENLRDDTILSILEQANAEQELKTFLSRDDRIQELIVKKEHFMNKIPKESIEPSRVMTSSANLYYRTTLKQKLSYQK